MNNQPDLLALQFATAGAGFKPGAGQNEPLVWVKHLLLLREWKAGEENVIRHIELHPGLNILWAKPRPQTEKPRLGEQGVFGHASGKTTFCRLLRHVLGEKHFGTADLQARVRKAFRGGWVVGEVRLNQESWLVCRPFTLGVHPFVVRNAEISRLFAGDLKREPLDVYKNELNKVIMERLPVATFATAPEPIEWPHLIQWLARDQESRFADLTDFRHKSSESESPDMDVEDRHFLFRAVGGLIDTVEQAELERNKTLVAQKQSAEKRAPLLRHQAGVTFKRLREELTDDYAAVEDELFLSAVQKAFEVQEVEMNRTINLLKEPTTLTNARKAATTAAARVENKASEIKELQEVIEGLDLELQVARGYKPQADVDAFWAKRNGGSKLCMEPLVRAKAHNCPLAAGKVIPGDQGQAAVKVENKADDIEKNIVSQKKRITALEKEKTVLVDAAEKAQTILTTAQTSFNGERDKLIEQRLKVKAVIRRAKEAKSDGEEATTLEKSVVELDRQIRQSRVLQAEAREKQKKALSDFSDTFDRVAKAILGLEVSGSIQFDGRQVETKMSERGDLTSAAIETLKILIFDLAALISSVEGRGFHPRFLIHDGPREADMAADLYQKIFLLAHELELAFGNGAPGFQYIVTTTEPPPIDLQDSPSQLVPVLDASTKTGRLFREDL
ncbi:MAG: hypothetical protein WCH99_19440 [Verrucomicrobiota bacterium]